MNPELIISRKIYFSFLFSSFIFLALLIMFFGKNISPLKFDTLFIVVSIAVSFIPAGLFLFRWYKKKVSKGTFIKLCVLAYIPVILGFLLSILYKNYLYFVLLFPVFFLSYLIIVPTNNFISKGE